MRPPHSHAQAQARFPPTNRTMLRLGRQSKRDRGMSIRNLSQESGDGGSSTLWPTSGGLAHAGKKRKPVVLVMGDSHTQGMYGACYVELLQDKFPQFRIVNGGRNGECLESIRRRTGPLLKTHGGDVVGVIIMGGTNDCLANLNASTRTLIRLYNPFLKEIPPLTEYTNILHALLATIYAHSASPYIDICCVTPPMIAEFPGSPENVVVDSLCDAIRDTVRDFTHNKRDRARTRGSCSSMGSSTDGIGAAGSGGGSCSTITGDAQDGKAHEQQQQQQPPPRHPPTHHPSHHPQHRHCSSISSSSSSSSSSSKHHHPKLRRRLHCIDFNARMKRHLEEIIGAKPRKAFEPDFFNMCFNSGVSLVSGTLVKWNTVSAARGLALHNDGVHLNEKAIGPLADALTVWLEALQEEIYMQHTREAYASASPVERLSTSLASTLKFAEETAKGGEGGEAKAAVDVPKAITAESGVKGLGVGAAEGRGGVASGIDNAIDVLANNRGDTVGAGKGGEVAIAVSGAGPVEGQA